MNTNEFEDLFALIADLAPDAEGRQQTIEEPPVSVSDEELTRLAQGELRAEERKSIGLKLHQDPEGINRLAVLIRSMRIA